jgi:hypothetical protein
MNVGGMERDTWDGTKYRHRNIHMAGQGVRRIVCGSVAIKMLYSKMPRNTWRLGHWESCTKRMYDTALGLGEDASI